MLGAQSTFVRTFCTGLKMLSLSLSLSPTQTQKNDAEGATKLVLLPPIGIADPRAPGSEILS